MTTAGHTRPAHGTRFEFVLDEQLAEGARYRCAVLRADGEWEASLELSRGEVTLVAAPAGLPDEARAQLVALARVMARRAADEPWPRRVLRWRQPGVR